MIFYFSIPTPENCISCPFKEVRVSSGYGPLKLHCAIDPSLDILAKDGVTKRSDNCPGKAEDKETSSVMEYKGYRAAIMYDAEDELFVGKVFGIIDSLSFDGVSVQELETSFHQCVDEYLEMCKSIGKEPDKSLGKNEDDNNEHD